MKIVSWLLTFLYQSLRVLLFLFWLFLISTYFIKPPADMNAWSAPHFMLLILYPATLLLHRLLKGRLFLTSLYKNYILFTYFVNECFVVGLQHNLVLLFLSNREKAFNSEGLGAGFLTVLLFWLFGWLGWGKSERKKVIKETRANFQAIPGSKPFPVSELIPWLWETPLLNHKSKFNNHSFLFQLASMYPLSSPAVNASWEFTITENQRLWVAAIREAIPLKNSKPSLSFRLTTWIVS